MYTWIQTSGAEAEAQTGFGRSLSADVIVVSSSQYERKHHLGRVEKLRGLRTWEDTNLSSQRRRNYLKKKKLIKNNQKEKLLSETP